MRTDANAMFGKRGDTGDRGRLRYFNNEKFPQSIDQQLTNP